MSGYQARPMYEDDNGDYDYHDDGMDAGEEAEPTGPQLSRGQQLAFRALMAAGTASEYVLPAVKLLWVPFVAVMGMSGIYCTSATKPFMHFASAYQQ